MKKIMIGVVVLLAAALIGLKYFAAKKQADVVRPAAPAETEQQGVALPAASTNYVIPNTAVTYTPAQATGSYELLNLPADALALKGFCEGGSPKEMLANHGKTWGYSTGRYISFAQKETQEMYGYLWQYYACLAAARQDNGVCSELPGEVVKDGVKFGVPMSETGVLLSPMAQCREKTVTFLFKAYVAGRSKDQQNCSDYVNEWDSENLSKISPPEFCEAAGQGPEKALAYVKIKMPKVYPMAEKMLAFSRKVCGSDSECLSNNDLWEGIKTGAADKCPAAYRPNCAALAQKDPTPCLSVLSEMSRKYCGYYKALLKHSGGFAGLTPEEVKEDLKLAAKKKAEEDALRKQEENSTKQINERVRKLIGNTKGE